METTSTYILPPSLEDVKRLFQPIERQLFDNIKSLKSSVNESRYWAIGFYLLGLILPVLLFWKTDISHNTLGLAILLSLLTFFFKKGGRKLTESKNYQEQAVHTRDRLGMIEYSIIAGNHELTNKIIENILLEAAEANKMINAVNETGQQVTKPLGLSNVISTLINRYNTV